MSNEQSVLGFAQSHAQRMQCTFLAWQATFFMYTRTIWLLLISVRTVAMTFSCYEQGVLHRILMYPKTFCTLKGV